MSYFAVSIIRVRWRPLVLMLVLVIAPRAAALIPAAKRDGLKPHSYPAASGVDVSRAIALAAAYLERACHPDGSFEYQIDMGTGQESKSYNVVRHAGAIYALTMLNRAHPQYLAGEVSIRAAMFLRHRYIGEGVYPGLQIVWSRPLPRWSDASLGATGLGLTALAAVRLMAPDSVPLDQLQSLGRFALFLQRPDGSFFSKYQVETDHSVGFESLYYPGEAALGLIYLYEADHSPAWLNAATRALSYLARRRAGMTTVPADSWALIATARLLSHCADENCAESRRELVSHAIKICRSILREQLRNPATAALDGSFDVTGRIAPTAARMEGLLAALEFLPEGRLRSEIKEAAKHGVAFLVRAQVDTGRYTGGMPGALVSSARGANEIRIDYVQHTLSALLSYQKLLQSGDARRH
jgi:hypothetical protein